ncbi:MAG TPA: ATP-dependent 6-phosphofructokinase [Candidatus Acidoferrales bacterium]|nr:ATP-dependent 6-phosphofructokinase [Candidatus Acidoferrales bacterium]
MRTIGVVTGGGDCPGLNAAIRAIVRIAKLELGWRVIGVADGFDGLMHPERCRELTIESVRGILPRGGTILGSTNSRDPFAYPVKEGGRTATKDCSPQCLDAMRQLGIDALIVIGGNGTLSIAHRLSQMGMKLVGVPKTIDNDLQLTDVTLGFDSALHVAMDAIDRLHTTAESHHRVIVVEVMGRDAGWIALDGGVAGGADVILLPEIPFTIENVCAAIRRREEAGRTSSIIVVAEGVKLPERSASGIPVRRQPGEHVADSIAHAMRECSDKEVRAMVLGHMQRGGSPSPFDRILATRFGAASVDLVSKEAYGQMVSLQGGKVVSVPLAGAISPVRLVDPASETLRAARAVGISFGDRP